MWPTRTPRHGSAPRCSWITANRLRAAWSSAPATLSELALGWATYNGDHMSMYGVNASIPKTLVRHHRAYMRRDRRRRRPAARLLGHLGHPSQPRAAPGRQDGDDCTENRGCRRPLRAARFLPVLHAIRMVLHRPSKVFRLAECAFAWQLRPAGNYPQVAQDVLHAGSSPSSSSGAACRTA